MTGKSIVNRKMKVINKVGLTAYGFSAAYMALTLFLSVALSCLPTRSTYNGSLTIGTSRADAPNIDQIQKDGGKYIKPDGWEIPLPEKRRKTISKDRNSATEDGRKIVATLTVFLPIDDYHFDRLPYNSAPGVTAVSGTLKLEGINELSVGGKVYGYTIYARKVLDRSGNHARYGMEFFYQLFDTDGDGRFETLVTDGSTIPIPNWTTE